MTREDAAVLCLDAAIELATRRTATANACVDILGTYLDQGQPREWEAAVIGLAKSVMIA